MKNVLTVATILMGTAAYSEGLTFGGSLDGTHNFDTEVTQFTVTPEVTYGWNYIDLTASTDLKLWDDELVIDDTFDVMPTIDFEVSHFVTPATEITLGTSYDLEAEQRGDIVAGISFNF